MRICRLAALALATLGAPAGAAEGEWRWRLLGDGDNPTLVYTDTDEGTDNFDSPRFTCKRASGTIRVEHVMRAAERKAFAAAIAGGKELEIDLIPPSPRSLFPEPQYSPVDGWTYGYEIQADDPALDRFKATGVYRYRVGKTPMQSKLTAGLETVGKFKDACRRSPSR